MIVGKYILETLYKNGIEHFYGIPSGTVSPIIDSLHDFSKIKYIITKNEASATYACCKSAKISDKLQCCIMSGAVGVANGINGIAESYQSKSPMLVISGYVNSNNQGRGAMQELEAHRYIEDFTKYNVVVNDPKDVKEALLTAMKKAMEHPRGPVHIGLPIDVQKSEIDEVVETYEEDYEYHMDTESLDNAINIINNSKKGVIIIGGACRPYKEKIKSLAKKLSWPVVVTTSGKGIISEEFDLCIGNYGFPGTDAANQHMADSDVETVIAIGTRLGENATNNYSADIFGKNIIHIEYDENSYCTPNNHNNEYIPVKCLIDEALDVFLEKVHESNIRFIKPARLNEIDHEYKMTGFSLKNLYENINKYVPDNTVFMNDIGSTWMYAHKYLTVPENGDYLCNANHACMGSSIGFIGVSTCTDNRPIVLFTGDGSFYMNVMSELLTAKKYNMNVVFVINNNATLGYVSKGHQYIFNRTLKHFDSPEVDIAAITTAMGIESITLRENEDLNQLEDFLKDIEGPKVIEVLTDGSEPLPSSRFKVLKNNA